MASAVTDYDPLEALIITGSVPDGEGIPSQSWPPQPFTCNRRVEKPVRVTAADKKLAKWVRAGYDAFDFERIDDIGHQRDTNEYAQRALNAGTDRWKLQKRLKTTDVSRHRRTDLTLRSAPIRQIAPEPGSLALIRLRLDADAHNGEPDARQVIDFIRKQYFGESLYTEPSEHGHAAYLDVVIPRLQWHGPADSSPNGDGTYFPSPTKINAKIDGLQAALVALVRAKGFKAAIEVNGRLEIRDRQADGSIRIVTRGRTAKLPRCKADTDIDRLMGSQFELAVIEQIIQDAPAVAPSIVEPEPVTSPVPTRSAGTLKTDRSRLRNTGDKNLNRWNCCREVALPLLGNGTSWDDLTETEQETMVDAANDLYVANRLNGGERDAARDNAFRQKFKRIFNGFDLECAKQGSGGLWFSETEDFEHAERLVRSVLSRKELKRLRQTSSLRGPLTYKTLAMALVMIGKTSNVGARGYATGDVPTKSLIGFFRYFGLTVNGTFARLAFDTLERLKLIDIDRRYWNGHHSRRMQLRGAACKIPFVSHLYTESKADKGDSATTSQHNSYLPAGAKSQSAATITSFEQSIVYMVFDLSGDADSSDPAYSAILNELEDEFAESSQMA